MKKIIGVKIDTSSPKTQDKIYYYKTEKDLTTGDIIDIKVPSGGSPMATVVETHKRNYKGPLKELEVVKD